MFAVTPAPLVLITGHVLVNSNIGDELISRERYHWLSIAVLWATLILHLRALHELLHLLRLLLKLLLVKVSFGHLLSVEIFHLILLQILIHLS